VLLENSKFIPLPDAPIFSDVSQDGKIIAVPELSKGRRRFSELCCMTSKRNRRSS
jgi:hypothetical protein